MSEWTSLHHIMKDLSVAQGCVVPASLEIFGNSAPPQMSDESSLLYKQEPSYDDGAGGDMNGPDFNLITKMIKLVKEHKDSADDVIGSDLNPFASEFIQECNQKKIRKNVAITSILNVKKNELAAKRPIPKDVIPTMFKRKSLNNNHYEVEEFKTEAISLKKNNQYTPSSRANEYYSKYVEKSKIRENFEEDIWSRVERQMKEIDEKKRRKAEFARISDSSGSLSSLSSSCDWDTVYLLQHRHQLTGECVVCNLFSKHGYQFEEML